MAATVAAAAVEDADVYPDEVLRCPVCQSGFRCPKLLPCLHTFCQQCLGDSLARSNIGPGQGFLCPICRYECQVPKRGVPALPHNVFYETLQEYLARKGKSSSTTENAAPPVHVCDGCDTGAVADRKCIECDDWLCDMCCTMHARVKVTRGHHLASVSELTGGGYDGLIKEAFEPLICGKHEEPLKLYCTEPSCLTPICTVCKTTLGHDGHRAVQLPEQAARDTARLAELLRGTETSLTAITQRLENLHQEEKLTSTVRKAMHKEINERMEQQLEKMVRQVSAHAERLHEEVERMAKAHKVELATDQESTQFTLKAMTSALQCGESLLQFGRPEEVVAMARTICRRLEDFQRRPDTHAPGWRQPRLHPPEELVDDDVARVFGKLTFEGEVIRCVLIKTINTRIEGDLRDVALSDVAVSEENDIIVVDRDNRKMKVFDQEGQLLFSTNETQFRAPNRVTILSTTGNAVVKDEKSLKVLAPDGELLGRFAASLRHPVATCQEPGGAPGGGGGGDVLVTDWVSGQVHCFSEEGQPKFTFDSNMEAPAYITVNQGGKVVISDWKKHEVRCFTKNGQFLFRYGGEGSGDGQLNHPYGLCTDHQGHVLIADNWNHRVHLVSPDGRFLRFLLGPEDGLKWPQAMVVDRQGHLLVAELQGTVKVYQYLA